MIVTELTELIGVLLIRVYQFNHKSISRLWFLTDGRPIFNQIISCTRFQEIVRVMRFNEARRARAPDKLQPIQKVFKMWNDTLLDTFVPGLYLTMDEQLLAFCGRCPFRQYILFTLCKHGIKYGLYATVQQVMFGRLTFTKEKNHKNYRFPESLRNFLSKNI